MSAPTVVPRAFVSCLACYNAGILRGEWYDAAEAADITPADLHGGRETSHEELWCLDHEGIPVSGEFGPDEAGRWGELYDELDNPEMWDPLCSWVRSGSYVEGGDGLPSLSDFEEQFAGNWPTFREYAEHCADEMGLLRDVPEDLRGFFDMRRWAEELQSDYTVEDGPSYTVYVFRNV